MVTGRSLYFDARLEPFSAVRQFIEAFCSDAAIPDQTAERLVLLVDELSANTARHGYPAARKVAGKWPIWLHLAASPQHVMVRYEDAAPAHDPFQRIVVPDYSGPVESWRAGGWGVPLITKLADDLHYERAGERNRICFTLRIDQPQRRPAVRT